jgi:hypothetical protein
MTTLTPKNEQPISGAVNLTLNQKLSEMVSVEDFGAIGDSTTNDYAALQAAFTWSATNQKAIYLQDKRYYTASTLNCNNAIIRSFSGNPGTANPYFYNNSSSYYMNYAPGASVTWSQMIAATCTGCCIISDQNIDILQITGASSFNISGIAVIGYHRVTNQCGIASAVGSVQTNNQYLKNVNVIGCGSSGINFRMGLQEGVLDTVNCLFNNGDGMTVTYHSGVQCAVDYNIIQNCHFQYNRGSGIFFSYVDKHLYITGCDFSANGQYDNGQQPGGSYIDPLLGYNRTPPTNVALMAAGIWINDADTTYNGGYIFDVSITNCEGELVACGLHLAATSSLGALQFLRVQNVSFYRSPLFPYSGGNNATIIFLNVNYLDNSLFSQIYNQSCDYINFPSGNPPSSTATVNSNLFLDNNITSGNTTTKNLQTFLTYQFPHSISTTGYTVANLPTGTTGVRAYVTDATATTFNSTVAGGGSNIVPVFYNGSNWVIG